MTQHRAFFNIKTQFDNAGDALIIRELIRLVTARMPAEVYTDRVPDGFRRMLELDRLPDVTAPEGGIYMLVISMLKARLRGIRCYYFLTPGGVNGEVSATGLASLAVISLLVALGVRINQVGVSFERIGPWHARLLRWRSRILHTSAVRDTISERYARDELGLRLTHLMPDLAVNLFANDPLIVPDPGRSAIGFSFRTDKDPAIKRRLVELVEAVCIAAPPETEFRFIAQVGRDLPFMVELRDRISAAGAAQTQVIDCHNSIDAAIEAYRPCRALVANRLHGLLLGLRAGAAPIALTTGDLDHKIRGVLESIGLDSRIVDLRTTTAAELILLLTPISFDGGDQSRKLADFFDDILTKPER